MFCTNPSTGYPGKFCVLVVVQVEAEMTFSCVPFFGNIWILTWVCTWFVSNIVKQ